MCFFFFNDTATTEIYTLSLHDALPISRQLDTAPDRYGPHAQPARLGGHSGCRMNLDLPHDLKATDPRFIETLRSEEHTSELQSRQYLVCRLLLEKKNNKSMYSYYTFVL